jgi:hypothetical protein
MTNSSLPNSSATETLASGALVYGGTTLHRGAIAYATALLIRYGIDLEGSSVQQWIEVWIAEHPATWLCLAIIEAIYLGRYKAVSVDQILMAWQRRGKAVCHFTHEFERLISRGFPHGIGALARERLGLETMHQLPQPIIANGQAQSPSAYISNMAPLVTPRSPHSASKTSQMHSDRGNTGDRIRQFIPSKVSSDFHERLKAVANR